MTTNPPAPRRGPKHDALEVFVGRWRAEGTSYGGTDQSGADPRAHGEPWRSTHDARWHTGGFFLRQDERARIAGQAFDTLSVLGVDAARDEWFMAMFDNHGFERRYRLTVEGRVWTVSGDTERATITFSDDNRRQTIVWEWKPAGTWRPLCDRVAARAE